MDNGSFLISLSFKSAVMVANSNKNVSVSVFAGETSSILINGWHAETAKSINHLGMQAYQYGLRIIHPGNLLSEGRVNLTLTVIHGLFKIYRDSTMCNLITSF